MTRLDDQESLRLLILLLEEKGKHENIGKHEAYAFMSSWEQVLVHSISLTQTFLLGQGIEQGYGEAVVEVACLLSADQRGAMLVFCGGR